MSNESVPKVEELEVEISEELKKDIKRVKDKLKERDYSDFEKIDPEEL